LKRFAKIPDVDVDFDTEMERVLNMFRITELVKRNFRDRGLQGKELRNLESLVEIFKNAVVEDLVLAKKDAMEIRMRRAGYLRYTNKTAYGIVEERYTDKDWKTGERITSSSSESSGLTSPTEELATLQRYLFSPHYTCYSDTDAQRSNVPDTPLLPVRSLTQDPDRRHLQQVHTRVSGDDGLDQKIIEPYHALLLPLTPDTTPKRPAILQLKVVENKENRIAAEKTNRGWLRQDLVRQAPPDRPSRALTEETTSLHPLISANLAPLKEPVPVVKPAWSQIAASVGPASRPSLGAENSVSINEEHALLLASRRRIEVVVNATGNLPAPAITGLFEPVNSKSEPQRSPKRTHTGRQDQRCTPHSFAKEGKEGAARGET
jgi:hypothetical protein